MVSPINAIAMEVEHLDYPLFLRPNKIKQITDPIHPKNPSSKMILQKTLGGWLN